MNFDLNVSCKQQQKLVMTQQMKISINILQIASYDLREYINREYEENPIIEIMVSDNDMGKVIGKSGKMAKVIRTLVQTCAFNKGIKRVKINIDSF